MSSSISSVTICGVKVPFPEGKKPFPQQLGVMQKIIASCIRSEHALLESPTGTGKTLALLCASLAWQKKHAADIADISAKSKLEYENVMATMDKNAAGVVDAAQAGVTLSPATTKAVASGGVPKENVNAQANPLVRLYDDDNKEEDDDEVFEVVPATPKTGLTKGRVSKKPAEVKKEAFTPPVPMPVPILPEPAESKPYVKIFYSSRTHSQLRQVVAELKRCAPDLLAGPETANRGLRMIVLGSRDHYCVNPNVTNNRSVNRNDSCKEVVKAKSCIWQKQYQRLATVTATQIQDVEDLVNDGKLKTGCPFFASRARFDKAHIVFLPYNYLLDSGIRGSMNMDINGSIIIFDEAHNVEDVARDAASIEVALESFLTVVKILKYAKDKFPSLETHINQLQDLAETLCSWASERPLATGDNFLTEKDGIVLQGPEAIASWESEFGLTINASTLELYRSALRTIEKPQSFASSQEEDESEEPDVRLLAGDDNVEVVSSAVITFFDNLLSRLEFMVQSNLEFARDFRIATVSRWTSASNPSNADANALRLDNELDEGHAAKRPRKSGNELFLCIWCMNPAVAFRPIKERARSIVLTSGTLSPLKAFAAELGCDFKHTLEASHVCDIRNQLFASAFTVMGDELLDATFRNAERLQYLNALGDSVMLISQETPGGVLVFFPSYAMLERCMNRWKGTGLWDTMVQRKPIFVETRGSSQEFERSVLAYRNQCKETNGAMFFAVFRGKLSEGIDFKDEAARAVVIIGIPYPNVKDLVVGLKKAHQDMARRRSASNLALQPLSGAEWYQQQAYRALNQALGRVIRHRYDYGAILLLDHRFAQRGTVENLSKWMRHAVVNTHDVTATVAPLRNFFRKLRDNPPRPGWSPDASEPDLGNLLGRPNQPVPSPMPLVKSSVSTDNSSNASSAPLRPLSQNSEEADKDKEVIDLDSDIEEVESPVQKADSIVQTTSKSEQQLRQVAASSKANGTQNKHPNDSIVKGKSKQAESASGRTRRPISMKTTSKLPFSPADDDDDE